MKKFENPSLEIHYFQVEDIITTSVPCPTDHAYLCPKDTSVETPCFDD